MSEGLFENPSAPSATGYAIFGPEVPNPVFSTASVEFVFHKREDSPPDAVAEGRTAGPASGGNSQEGILDPSSVMSAPRSQGKLWQSTSTSPIFHRIKLTMLIQVLDFFARQQLTTTPE